jgi:hypothetical protein
VPKLADGTWKFFDDLRYPAPSWEEMGGRSGMSGNTNKQSTSNFPSFATQFRLLDKDRYWVDAPGFRHCAFNNPKVTCVFTP